MAGTLIKVLDDTLQTLLESQINGTTVGFDIPNSDWRNTVAQSAGGNFLNVYLVEMRENRRLRSNEVVKDWQNGSIVQTPVPLRLDCHYLVSAWTRAGVAATPLVEATIDESEILYEAARVLMNSVPLDVGGIYTGADGAAPPELLDQPLPMVVASPEGFNKIPDFWMRMDWPWKPVVELIVTVPVVALQLPAGPPVTTLFTEILQTSVPVSTEELVTIGGAVWSGSARVPGAWVRLIELDRVVTADPLGRFLLERVPRGTYHFEVLATGHAVAPSIGPVDVPSGSGTYDLWI
jgi:hypothetical protein